MKKIHQPLKMFAGFAAVTLMFAGTTSVVTAAAPPLSGQVEIRPLTPTEIDEYSLGNAQVSGGLKNVAEGEPVYLDALVNAAIAPSNIVGVVWSLPTNNIPAGSAASLLPSPLGANVPLYNPADRTDNTGNPEFQLAGRALFRPDVPGAYTVLATISTVDSGSTNIAVTVTCGTWMGANTCAGCHGGSIAGVPVMYPGWTNTPHATFFTKAIQGLESSHYNASCIKCHTVGYDTNSFAINGGFDDIAKLYNWTFPSTWSPTNWTGMPSLLQNLANIQCENCHGPGSEHVYNGGDTNFIAVNYNSGDCSQCHDDLNNHVKSAEWQNSVHAITTRDPAGNASCVGCHTARGYIGRISGWSYTNTTYEAINCQTCHDPHSYNAVNNPEELRVTLTNGIALMDGTVVTNAGLGALCMSCHHARQNAAVYAATANGSTYFGPHEGPQADMLEGVNGFTYGQAIPTSAHANAVSNTCVTCHMQAVATSDPGFTHVGGHTFSMAWDGTGTNGPEEMIGACQNCHGASVTQFDFPLQDYANLGVIAGVQTEVQALMNQLALLLPPVGQAKSDITINSTWTRPQLEAGYNYRFVQKDGSFGIHNTAYAVGLLKASIANLTGVSVPGGLPDAWVIQYFGSVTNAAAAPNAVNNSAGVPNWMMYALGLNPTAGFTMGTNGVIYFNGNNIVNGATNTIAIYKAAEIAFDTQVGTTYQIQGISALTGGWQNISTNIPGTGGSISYLTPTRNNVQMFYRVVHTP